MNNDERRERCDCWLMAQECPEVYEECPPGECPDERRDTHNHPAGYGCTPRCVVPSDHDTDQCGCDERRERYAAAMWPYVAGKSAHMDEAADAAMAVADAELDSTHRALAEERDVAVRTEAENAHLRAEQKTADEYAAKMRDEIERWRVENARLRAELEDERRNVRDLEALIRRQDEEKESQRQAINRLRAELEEWKAKAEIARLARERYRENWGEALATIARVRSVLDEMEANGRTSWTLDLRAALEGGAVSAARDALTGYTDSSFTEFGRRVIAGYLDAYAAEVRSAALREAADALAENMGPRTMEHESERVARFVQGYYAAIDEFRRMAAEGGEAA